MVLWGIYLAIKSPASTPIRRRLPEQQQNLKHQPYTIRFGAISMVANCVLSPSSARNISRKVMISVFILSSIYTFKQYTVYLYYYKTKI